MELCNVKMDVLEYLNILGEFVFVRPHEICQTILKDQHFLFSTPPSPKSQCKHSTNQHSSKNALNQQRNGQKSGGWRDQNSSIEPEPSCEMWLYQPCPIYYNPYNIVYCTERRTITIKVGKIYYITFNYELYYKSTRKQYNKSHQINDVFNCQPLKLSMTCLLQRT